MIEWDGTEEKRVGIISKACVFIGMGSPGQMSSTGQSWFWNLDQIGSLGSIGFCGRESVLPFKQDLK